MISDKRICIFYTGGTIGMVQTERGYAPKKGYFNDALKKIPDLNSELMPKWELFEMDPLLDSSNVALNEWNIIGEFIYDHYDDFDGFVILHGTDTMSYTASALSFMLRGLGKPVVITGSQIPLCNLRSDADDNLITSIIIAAEGVVNEVCLYFGGKLLRGNRSEKMSADKLIAFDSPNFPYLATAGISITYDKSLLMPKGKELEFCRFKEAPVGVLKLFPGIQFDLFESVILDNLSAIVLETFGTGNIPGRDDGLIPLIERAFRKGKIVVVCSQCAQGTIKFGTYETSAALKNSGAVCGYDLTTEAAVTKLYYLFSRGYEKEKIKRLMETDLCGEMTI